MLDSPYGRHNSVESEKRASSLEEVQGGVELQISGGFGFLSVMYTLSKLCQHSYEDRSL